MIKLSEPFFFGKEIHFLKKCLKDNWISPGGKIVKIFEKKMKKYTTGRYNLGTVNCTSALQLAIRLLNPKQNEEVLVPTITFVATINSVIYNNCRPVFIDCDEQLLLDRKNFYSFIQKNTYFKNGFTFNKKTKKKILSIIIVNTFGNLFNLDSHFVATCRKQNIKIIEDAAESLGSYYYDRKKNRGIEYSCYSFNGNKLITSGGGGMISMNSKKNHHKATYLSSQAKKDSIQFIHDDVGYNMQISNLHASIGLAQISNVPKVLIKKNKINILYKKKINSIEGLQILSNPEYCYSNNWLNILVVEKRKYGLSKNQIIKEFSKFNIETRSLWYPNHLQKPFKKYQKYNIKKSKQMYESCLCLPSSYSLKKSDQEKIINLLKNKFKK